MTKKAPEKKAVKPSAAKKPAVKKAAVTKPAAKGKSVDLAKMVASVSEDMKTNPVKPLQTSKPPVKAKVEKKPSQTLVTGISTSTLISVINDKSSGLPTNASIGSDMGPKTLINVPTRQELRKVPEVKTQTQSQDGKVLAKDLFKKPSEKRQSSFNFTYR